MTIHRDTPPPVIEGTTYRTIQTNSRKYVEDLDKKGITVYIWDDVRGKQWVAYPEVEYPPLDMGREIGA